MTNPELSSAITLTEDKFKSIFSSFLKKPISTYNNNKYRNSKMPFSELGKVKPNLAQLLETANREVNINNEEDLLEVFENDSILGPMAQILMIEIKYRDEIYNNPMRFINKITIDKPIIFGEIDEIKYENPEALYHAIETMMKGHAEFPDDIETLDGENIFSCNNTLYYECDELELLEKEENAQILADFFGREIEILANPSDLNSIIATVSPSAKSGAKSGVKATREWAGNILT